MVNPVLLALENLAPPTFQWLMRGIRRLTRFSHPRWRRKLAQTIEAPGCQLHLEEMQMEENAGLGLGVTFLTLASVLAAGFIRVGKSSAARSPLWRTCVLWAPIVSFLVFMTQSNLSAIARLLTPYYLLLLPVLLVASGHERIVKQRWWRVTAFGGFILAAVLVVVSPARRCFRFDPAGKNPGCGLSSQVTNQGGLFRLLPVVTTPLPPSAMPAAGLAGFGLVTHDDPEASLWHPYGSRRMVHICPSDTTEELKAQGVE